MNPLDCRIRSGWMQSVMPVSLPVIPGQEVAGVVDALGPGVAAHVGDEVFGFADTGASAEYVLLSNYALKPTRLSWEQAAALPTASETSVRCLDLLGVKADHTLLVDGASGGVGAIAVQLALARGAQVIGTASPAKLGALRELGAVAVPHGDGLAERVRELAPQGVDAALDVAGKGSIQALVELTGSPARVITIADPSAPQHGVRMSAGIGTYGQGRSFHALAEAAWLAERALLKVPVASSYPLERLADAHRRSQQHSGGKLVVTIGV